MPLPRPRWGRLALLASLVVCTTGSRWAPRLLHHADYFRVRHIRVEGVVHGSTDALIARSGVTDQRALWDDVVPVVRALEADSLVADAWVGREVPGTLVFHVRERRPVALLVRPAGLQPIDSTGRALPIDPVRVRLDLPLATTTSSVLLGRLAAIEREVPSLARLVNDASERRDATDSPSGRPTFVLHVPGTTVLFDETTPVSRFDELTRVGDDLVKRGVRPDVVDLRVPGQILVRVQHGAPASAAAASSTPYRAPAHR